MKTLDMSHDQATIQEVLNWACSDSVLIRSQDGHEFLVEEVDDFEEEAAQLRASKPFMRFLEERSKEKGTITIEEIEASLKK